LIGRLAEKYNRPAQETRDEVIDVLHTLTSFATFDNLAGTTRGPEEVVPLVCRLAHAVLQLDEGGTTGGVPVVRPEHGAKRCP
jgi:hypothetical protein